MLTPATELSSGSSTAERSVTYRCRKLGAFLSVPHDGLRQDVVRTKAFEDYIRDHIDSWFSLAQRSRLDVQRMEDIILVSGCTLVTSWAVAVFLDNTLDTEISLGTQALDNGGANFQWRIAGEISASVEHKNSFHQSTVRFLGHIDLTCTDPLLLKGTSSSKSMRIHQGFPGKTHSILHRPSPGCSRAPSR